MLQKIRFLFPDLNEEAKSFLSIFRKMLQELPNVTEANDLVIIQATNPPGALPEITVESSKNDTPVIQFDSNSTVDDEVNGVFNRILTSKEANNQISTHLSMSELYKKLTGHTVRVDHVGINIPSTKLTVSEWDRLIHNIARITAIYNYPTGEKWPFILPSTESEFESDISKFHLGREPKFELVYDELNKLPTFQFDIETDLTQIEVEQLFPAPIGESFNGLETYFRVVYVISPYSNIIIRFDIRFKNYEVEDDWNTGKWLVKEGKRITLEE